MKTKNQKRKEAVSRARISWEVKQHWKRYDNGLDYLMLFVPRDSTTEDLAKYGIHHDYRESI